MMACVFWLLSSNQGALDIEKHFFTSSVKNVLGACFRPLPLQ